MFTAVIISEDTPHHVVWESEEGYNFEQDAWDALQVRFRVLNVDTGQLFTVVDDTPVTAELLED